MHELIEAIRLCKNNSSPGADRISYEILKTIPTRESFDDLKVHKLGLEQRKITYRLEGVDHFADFMLTFVHARRYSNLIATQVARLGHSTIFIFRRLWLLRDQRTTYKHGIR